MFSRLFFFLHYSLLLHSNWTQKLTSKIWAILFRYLIYYPNTRWEITARVANATLRLFLYVWKLEIDLNRMKKKSGKSTKKNASYRWKRRKYTHTEWLQCNKDFLRDTEKPIFVTIYFIWLLLWESVDYFLHCYNDS